MLEGVFEPGRFLSLVRDFIVFEDDGNGGLVKKMAGYHQLYAVWVAVDETLRAAELQRGRIAEVLRGRYEAGRNLGGASGDRRIRVVWHTQGSGKSLTMAFYAGAIVREPLMENPTVVVLTDRNDLDDQVLGDETLRDIARELVATVRGNVTIDWTLRENVRANLRRLVRRILRRHGYPPDKQEKATVTVLEQAEALSWGWAGGLRMDPA